MGFTSGETGGAALYRVGATQAISAGGLCGADEIAIASKPAPTGVSNLIIVGASLLAMAA
jgi:hypothetical protein